MLSSTDLVLVAAIAEPPAPLDPVLLASAAGSHDYDLRNARLYLDNRPGAFEPISFVVNNETLSDGETTYGFFNAAGFIVWSYTGNIMDIGPKNPDGSTKVVAQQGYSWVGTATSGVSQLYWSHEQWERVVIGGEVELGAGNSLGLCKPDSAPHMRAAGA
jgi:hypothetical protein